MPPIPTTRTTEERAVAAISTVVRTSGWRRGVREENLPVDQNRGRVDVELRHLQRDDVALGLHHSLVQLALKVRERSRAGLRLHPLLFEELAQLLKGRRPGLPRGTRGQLHARRSVRHRYARSNPRQLAEIPAIPTSRSDLHPKERSALMEKKAANAYA